MADKLPRGALRAGAEALEDAPPGQALLSEHEAARIVLEAALPVIVKAVQRDMARHLLALDALAHGWLCPACHGKPAVIPDPRGATAYRCGCGHEWERTARSKVDWGSTAEYTLKAMARGKPLPELPAKITVEQLSEVARG